MNKPIIQALYQHFASRNLEAIRELFHEDIVWQQMEGFPGGGTHRGIDAIFTNVFGRFSQEWDGWKAQTSEFIEGEHSVFVIGCYVGTHKITGRSVKADFVHHYRLQGGKIKRFEQYTDTLLVSRAALS